MKRLLGVALILAVLVQLFSFTVLGAGEYRTWLQSDSRWGSINFGDEDVDTMSKSGCAITSVAKLLVHSGAVADDESQFNPKIYVNWLKSNGGVTSQGWIVWSAAAGYSSKFSYYGEASVEGATKSEITATVKSYIDKGYVVVVAVKNFGHYVAVDKVADNTVYIMDSAANGYKELFGYSGIVKLQIYKGPHNGSGNNGGSTTPSYDTKVDPVGVGNYTITSDNGVNLRSGAGTSHNILTAIPYNTVVRVTELKNGWGKTTYDGKTGWFSLTYAKLKNALRGLQITAPTKLTYQKGEGLDITGLKVTALYADGTSKTVAAGNYTVSKYDANKTGEQTVYVSYQTKAAAFKVTVTEKTYVAGVYKINTDGGVNLRSGAGTDYATVGNGIPNTTRVTVTEINKNWGKTTYNGHSGWICLDYAVLLEEQATVVAIELTAKQPCVLSGVPLMSEQFEAVLVYSDGSTEVLTEFELVSGKTENGIMQVQVKQGNLSGATQVKVFDAVPAGDCNFDGDATAADALDILKRVVGKSLTVFYEDAADVDYDGDVTAADALAVLQYVVGKRPSLALPVTTTDL